MASMLITVKDRFLLVMSSLVEVPGAGADIMGKVHSYFPLPDSGKKQGE